MWRLVAAAELPAPVDNTGAYTVLAGTIFTGLLALAGVIVSNRSKNRTEPSPPAPTGNGDGKLRERIAVAEADIVRLNGLADDSEDRDEFQDRRLDNIEARLDRLNRPKHGTER